MNPTALDLDVGNSRIKWRYGELRGRGQLDELPVLQDGPSTVRVSTVSARREELQQRIVDCYGIQPQFAVTTKKLAGVVNGYRDAQQLGVDRWLAMVAAFNRIEGGAIVVDAGTALTIDLVDAAGFHRGGVIVPGLKTLHTALARQTSDVDVELQSDSIQDRDPFELALDTDSAVTKGCLAMLSGFVETTIHRQIRERNETFTVFLAGGDATQIQRACGLAFRIDQDLIFDGLALAFPN